MGKTEAAKALALVTGGRLIRLQCYEGIDVAHALYDWNHARQLLYIRTLEASEALDPARTLHDLFGREFLEARPLLEAIEHTDATPPVLLIDEIDRADDEFEAFLLELLSDFQVTIPEIGTVRAKHRPRVVLTSNRTRDLHDALKRRCLYHWIGHPDTEREVAIVRARVPGVPERLAVEAATFVASLRDLDLAKVPGVAETIDWIQALVALGQAELDAGRGRRDARHRAEAPRGHRARARRPPAEARRPRPRGLSVPAPGDAVLERMVGFGRVLRVGRDGGRPGPAAGRAARARRGRARPPRRRLPHAARDAGRAARGDGRLRRRLRRVLGAGAGDAAAGDRASRCRGSSRAPRRRCSAAMAGRRGRRERRGVDDGARGLTRRAPAPARLRRHDRRRAAAAAAADGAPARRDPQAPLAAPAGGHRAATCSTPGGRCDGRSGHRACRSTRRSAAASRCPASSCSCATCRARWSRMRARS